MEIRKRFCEKRNSDFRLPWNIYSLSHWPCTIFSKTDCSYLFLALGCKPLHYSFGRPQWLDKGRWIPFTFRENVVRENFRWSRQKMIMLMWKQLKDDEQLGKLLWQVEDHRQKKPCTALRGKLKRFCWQSSRSLSLSLSLSCCMGWQ